MLFVILSYLSYIILLALYAEPQLHFSLNLIFIAEILIADPDNYIHYHGRELVLTDGQGKKIKNKSS